MTHAFSTCAALLSAFIILFHTASALPMGCPLHRKRSPKVRIHLRTKGGQKGYGIAYDHVGYAVSFCSCCGISTTPIKLHQMTKVCFFVRVPGIFSGFFTSIFSTKNRMISAVSSVMSVYRRTIPKKESTFRRCSRASAMAASSSETLASNCFCSVS